MVKKFHCIGFVLLAMVVSVDSRGQSSICDPLARAINNRSVRCNLGNWFDATQCKYPSGQTMASSFLSVCRICEGKSLPAKHPGYTNVRCENIQPKPQPASKPQPQPQPQPQPKTWPPFTNTVPPYVDAVNSRKGVEGPAAKPVSVSTPAPAATNAGGHMRPVPGPAPTTSDCNGLRRALDSGHVFCTIVNLYDANYCMAADGKTTLLNSFISRCPSCRDKTPRHDSSRRCDLPDLPPKLGSREPSSIRYDRSDWSIKTALYHMIPPATVMGQSIIDDYHILLKNPTEALGVISATFESFGTLTPQISVKLEKDGTRSWGIWQINSARRMDEFLDKLAKGELVKSGVNAAQQKVIYAELVTGFQTRAAAVVGSGKAGGQFETNWKAVANNPRLTNDFKELQREYVKRTHFYICYNLLREKHPSVAIINDPVIQELIWSTSVQHGPGGVGNPKGCYAIMTNAIRYITALKPGRPPLVLDVIKRVPDERFAVYPPEAPRYNREAAVNHWVILNRAV